MSENQQQVAKTSMTNAYRWIVVVVLVIAVGAALYLRPGKTSSTVVPSDQEIAQSTEYAPNEPATSEREQGEVLPRLVDLGADKCIPCKMMAPILEELRQEYAGRFKVVFIDVWKKKSEAQKYGIRVIPTQIFYDGTGKELFRHQGFFSKEDILKTWQKHGFDFGKNEAVEGSS